MKVFLTGLGLTILILAAGQTAHSQVLQFDFEEQVISGRGDEGRGVDSNGLGDVFVGGWRFVTKGADDISLYRFDEDNSITPTVQAIISPGADRGLAVSCDGAGSVFVAGFTGGHLPLSNVVANFGQRDLCVCKFDEQQNLLLTTQHGSIGTDEARGVITDDLGNLYVTGSTNGQLPMAILLGTTDGSQTGGSDAFLIKYDSNLNIQWVRQLATPQDEAANAISLDSSGNIYIAGFAETVLPGNLAGTTNSSGNDAFVSKFDATGTLVWTRQLGSDADATANGIDVTDNRIYFAGSTLDGLPNPISPHHGGSDAFVARMDLNGALAWTQHIGTSSNDFGNAVSSDSNRNPYITGETSGALARELCGSSDIFTASLTYLGGLVDTNQIGDIIDDAGYGIHVDDNDKIFSTGSGTGDLISCSPPGVFFNATAMFVEAFESEILGDVNCDGVFNLLDNQPFVTLIVTGQFLDKADINRDGTVNLLDVAPFVALLVGS